MEPPIESSTQLRRQFIIQPINSIKPKQITRTMYSVLALTILCLAALTAAKPTGTNRRRQSRLIPGNPQHRRTRLRQSRFLHRRRRIGSPNSPQLSLQTLLSSRSRSSPRRKRTHLVRLLSTP